MKRKKLRDLVVSCFLISTLGIAAFIVSCSDENFLSSRGGSNPYHPHSHNGEETNIVTHVFTSVADGATGQVGTMLLGWVLSGIGMAQSSGPDYTNQFSRMQEDLQNIENSLNDISGEISELNCDVEVTSINDAVSMIGTCNKSYSDMLSYWNTPPHDTTGNYNKVKAFIDLVENNNGANIYSLDEAIQTILHNFETPSLSVIKSCLSDTTGSSIPSGTFGGDTTYYSHARALLNYYYGNLAVGIGLLNEVSHYQAWHTADSLGQLSGITGDSVQQICQDLQYEDCFDPINVTNQTYNDLLAMFLIVGAPYTGEDLLYQKASNGNQLVWVKSLEDFTDQAQPGACSYPLGINNLCGLTTGKAFSVLSETFYYGTQNFQFANSDQLGSLLSDVAHISDFTTVGGYLESKGFENMSNKIVIATNLTKVSSTGASNFFDTMSVVPFFNTSTGVYTNSSGTHRAMYSSNSDFITLMGGPSYSVTGCCDCDPTDPADTYEVHWLQQSYNTSLWGNFNILDGTASYCQYPGGANVQLPTPLVWSSTSKSPGWSYYLTRAQPQAAFLLPVRSDATGSDGCLHTSYSGFVYSNLNGGGVLTQCGQDFHEFLALNIPLPPTCKISTKITCKRLP